MRWEIIKKAWQLANQKFPKAKLYVDMPDRFTGSGECSIFDLEKPNDPLGKIVYQARCEDGKPVLSMKIDETEEKAELSKTAALQFKVASQIQDLAKKNTILASDIMAQYRDPAELGEQVAYLIVGHEDGLGVRLDSNLVDEWISMHGFPAEISGEVTKALSSIGVVVAKRSKKRAFENYEKVRVADPRIMEYNEGARIIGHKRDNSNDWYQIIVDGSDKPIWLHEKQLAKNTVGSINDISSIDKGE